MIGLARIRRLAALERPADPHKTAFDPAAGREPCRQKPHILARDINPPAAAIQAIGQIRAGCSNLRAAINRNASAMGQPACVCQTVRVLDDPARLIGHRAALTERAGRNRLTGQRQKPLCRNRDRAACLAPACGGGIKLPAKGHTAPVNRDGAATGACRRHKRTLLCRNLTGA